MPHNAKRAGAAPTTPASTQFPNHHHDTPTPYPNGSDDFDLLTCSPLEFLAFLAGYRTGLMQATESADRRRDEEERAVYALAVRTVRAAAKLPTHDEHQGAVLRRTFEAAARHRAAETRWSA